MGLLQDEQIIWNTNIMFLAILVWLGYNYLDFVIVIVGLSRLLWIFAWFWEYEPLKSYIKIECQFFRT